MNLGDKRQPEFRGETANPLIGQTIGDFEILEEVGRGGMGVVFRARQISLDRIVAFKILSGSLGLTKQAISRFRREAQATAKLHHPNIVPVYAQGQQDQTYYYAMELVSGESLFDIIATLRNRSDGYGQSGTVGHDLDVRNLDQNLPDPALAETELISRDSQADTRITTEQTEVDYVASSSLVSGVDQTGNYTAQYYDEIARQIKAVADALDYAHRSGVIHRDIKPHNLLVGDGGRLCLSDFGLARVLEQPGVTITGEFVGSPLYMSPEQMTGSSGAIGPTTDIYSLGATLYEWLTLKPPFPGATREQVISSVITGDLVPPRTFNPQIPVDLETICLKALAKDPSKRYQTARDMADDLQRFLNRDYIKARRDGILTSLVKTISRWRVASTIAVATVLIVCLVYLLAQEKQNRKRAVVETQQEVQAVTKENERLQQEKDELAGVVEKFNLGQRLATAVRAGGFLSGLLPTADGDSEEYVPITDDQRIGAMFLTSLRESETARLHATDAPPIETGSAKEYYLKALTEERSADTALENIERCLKLKPSFTDARLLRAWIRCQLSDGPGMLADADAILAVDPLRGDASLARAVANLLLKKYEDCLADLAKATATLGSDYRVDILQGVALAKTGKNDKAMVALGRVLTLQPDCALALLKHAIHSAREGHLEVAVVDFTRVLQLEPRNAEVLELRGECYDKLRQYDKARADYLAAVDISGKPTLYFKAGTSAANLAQQNINRQEKERKVGDQKADSEIHSLLKPRNTDTVQESLMQFLKSRVNENGSSVNASSRTLFNLSGTPVH